MSAHNDSNKQPESISDPRRDLGLIPGSSRIEIKWCIRSENMDEEDVWWKATVTSIEDTGVVEVLYEAMPRLGFPQAERAAVRFLNRFYLEHDVCDRDVQGETQTSFAMMQWRYDGDTRDLDALDDTTAPAADVIRKELCEEIKTRSPEEQRVLAAQVHSALEAFKDEIWREAVAHNNEINDRSAENILARIHQRLLGDEP